MQVERSRDHTGRTEPVGRLRMCRKFWVTNTGEEVLCNGKGSGVMG